MKNHSKPLQIHINLNNMVKPQLGKIIKVFWCDNDMEYRDSKLLNFLYIMVHFLNFLVSVPPNKIDKLNISICIFLILLGLCLFIHHILSAFELKKVLLQYLVSIVSHLLFLEKCFFMNDFKR